MNSRVLGAIARLLTPWRTIRQLESEVERLKEILGNPYLAGVKIGKGVEVSPADLTISSHFCPWASATFAY